MSGLVTILFLCFTVIGLCVFVFVRLFFDVFILCDVRNVDVKRCLIFVSSPFLTSLFSQTQIFLWFCIGCSLRFCCCSAHFTCRIISLQLHTALFFVFYPVLSSCDMISVSMIFFKFRLCSLCAMFSLWLCFLTIWFVMFYLYVFYVFMTARVVSCFQLVHLFASCVIKFFLWHFTLAILFFVLCHVRLVPPLLLDS